MRHAIRLSVFHGPDLFLHAVIIHPSLVLEQVCMSSYLEAATRGVTPESGCVSDILVMAQEVHQFQPLGCLSHIV